MNIFRSYFKSPIGLIDIQATEDDIIAMLFIEEAQQTQTPNTLTREASQQLSAYFAQTLTKFDLPLSSKGTEFQQNVWQTLKSIPYGTTCSYGDIARKLNNPNAVRAVGAANGKNPISIVVPCHRVIGANGTLTGYAGGLERKTYLLSLEKAI